MREMNFDYYYGEQSESFRFLRVSRLLFTAPQFRDLSTDAKLLYSLMLDRMCLSARNGWYDEQGRVFIYYTDRYHGTPQLQKGQDIKAAE